MNNNEVMKRLQNLIGYIPTQKSIVEKTGIKQSTLSTKSSRNSRWTDEEIQKLNDAFSVDIYKEISQNIANNKCVSIIYLPDVYLSAGYGFENENEQKMQLMIDAALLVSERGNKINPQHCKIVKVSGNSMAPEYRHGDRVIIDENDRELSDGQIFAFRYEGKCYVKEINLMGRKIKCISLNKDYDPFYINENEDFKVIGRILPRIRL